MNIKKSIRKDAARLHADTKNVIKEWDTVLYNSGWPCSDELPPGDRLELSQVAFRLTLLKAAAHLLQYAIR